MKKVTFLMALAVAAGMASCTAQSPKADLKTDIDSLSYAIGMARTEGLDLYLAQQGIDSTIISKRFANAAGQSRFFQSVSICRRNLFSTQTSFKTRAVAPHHSCRFLSGRTQRAIRF